MRFAGELLKFGEHSSSEMAAPRILPTIITFSIIALVLAGIAAFLPHDEDAKIVDNFRVDYEIGGLSIPTSISGKENLFDFLKFELNPVEVGPIEKIVRSRQPISQKIALPNEDQTVELIKSPSSSVVVIADNSTEIFAQLQAFLEEANEIRAAVVKSENPDDCDLIENAVAARSCRNEIYFQKAISEKDVSLCAEIANYRSRSRCENYVNLIPANEVES